MGLLDADDGDVEFVTDENVNSLKCRAVSGSKSEGKKKKAKTAVTPSPQLHTFETQIIEALKDDPRLLEISLKTKEYDLQKMQADDLHNRNMAQQKMILDKEVALEKIRSEIASAEAAKSAADATKAQTAMMAKVFDLLSKQQS